MNNRQLILNTFIPLGVGTLLAVIAYWLVQFHIDKEVEARPRLPALPIPETAVLVSGMSLKPGDTLASSILAVRSLPSEGLPADTLTPSSLEKVLNKEVIDNVPAGKPLQRIHLARESAIDLRDITEQGMQPFTVSSSPYWTHDQALTLGDEISIYEQHNSHWSLLVDSAPIIRLSPSNETSQPAQYQFVTFSVPKEQIARVDKLHELSKLKFILKSNVSTAYFHARTSPDLVGVYAESWKD